MRNYAACSKSLVLTVALLTVGCQYHRSSFQIDSDSRIPFFGLQLTRPSSEENETPTRTISGSGQTIEPQTLKRESRPPRWKHWLGRLRSREPIPLPRTDLPAESDS